MKHVTKIFALLLCFSLLLPLTACGRNLPVVMECNGLRLEEDIYHYWLSCYRAQFAYSETAENRERLAEMADLNIMKTLVAASLFDGYGLQLGNDARAVIQAAMDSLVKNAGGTREEFDQAAAAYGIDFDGMKLAISYEQKAEGLYQYLFGKNGVYEITDEQYEAYYQKTYARVKMVYVSYVDFVLDADGERIWDQKTGSYLFEKKTGTALSLQEGKAEQVRASLDADKSEAAFDALILQYNEDPAVKTYPNGFYFSSKEDYSDYIPALTSVALTLEPGNTAEVRTPYGVHFLLALAPEKGAYDKEANQDFFTNFKEQVARDYYERMISEQLTGVTIYHEVKDKLRYEDVEPNFDLYW